MRNRQPRARLRGARLGPRKVLLVAGAALVILFGSGGATVVAATHRTAPAPGPAIDAVLARWTTAVQTRDEAAFLADVDRSRAGLVAHRRALYRALSMMPVSHVSWRRGGPGTYTLPGLDQRYHAATSVVAVLFSYRVDGVDEHTSMTPEGFTFAAEGGRWVLAGESDVDAELPYGGHALPWDLEDVAVATGKDSVVVGDVADRAALAHLAVQADIAVQEVRKVWPDWQHQKVVVFVPRDPRVIDTYFRSPRQSVESTAAVTVPVTEGVEEWVGSGWASIRSGQRVVLNPRNVSLGDADLPFLLRHEFAHVATAGLTAPGTPTWLVEGAAEWTSFYAEPSEREFPDDVVNDAADGKLLDTLPGPVDFYTQPHSYDVSFLVCDYIQEKYGLPKLRQLYDQLSTVPNDAFSGQAQDQAIPKVLGVSAEQLVRGVDAWAEQQFS